MSRQDFYPVIVDDGAARVRTKKHTNNLIVLDVNYLRSFENWGIFSDIPQF